MKRKACLVLFCTSAMFGCWFKVAQPPATTLLGIRDGKVECETYARQFKTIYRDKENDIEYSEAEVSYEKAKSAYDVWIDALKQSVNNDTRPQDIGGYAETCRVAAERSTAFIEYVRAKTSRPASRAEGVPKMPAFGGQGDEKKLPTREELINRGLKVVEDYFKAKKREKEQRKAETIKALEELRWTHFRRIE